MARKLSPDGKRICEVSNKEIESSADDKATDGMDAGLNNLNMEVQELRKKIDVSEKEIKVTNDRCLSRSLQ